MGIMKYSGAILEQNTDWTVAILALAGFSAGCSVWQAFVQEVLPEWLLSQNQRACFSLTHRSFTLKKFKQQEVGVTKSVPEWQQA